MALSAAFYTSSQPSRALLCRTREPNFSQTYQLGLQAPWTTPSSLWVINLQPHQRAIVGNGNSRKILLASSMRSMKRRERVLLRTS